MGNDPTFDQNAKDFDRLSEVVCLRSFGLTVPSAAEMKVLNLSTLFSEIVADTEFESRNRNCTVQPLIEGDICVRGNGDLLCSAMKTPSAMPFDIQLLLRHTVFTRFDEVRPEMNWTVQGNKRGNSHQDSVTLRQLWALPYVPLQHVVGQFANLGAKSPIGD